MKQDLSTKNFLLPTLFSGLKFSSFKLTCKETSFGSFQTRYKLFSEKGLSQLTIKK